MDIKDKDFLNVHEARAFLGVSRAFLYRLKKEGLPAYALGRKTYFRRDDMEKLFTSK